MREKLAKIKEYTKRVAILSSLFLAAFLIGFYTVNFDFSAKPKTAQNTGSVATTNLDEEFAKRLGATTFSVESYAGWAKRFGLKSGNDGLDADPDTDGLLNYLEYVHGTNPLKTDTDGDSYADKSEIDNGYDPDALGDPKLQVEILIAKINVEVPMIWSKSEKESEMLAELEKGVSHFNKTAAPGQVGNMIISGHSSNYFWAKGDYNHIFKNLNDLEKGDVVSVRTTQQNGRVITYQYKVRDKFITIPNDAEIFEEAAAPTLTLSTCWPLGTNLKRVIVKASLE